MPHPDMSDQFTFVHFEPLGNFLPRMKNEVACRLIVKLASLKPWRHLEPNSSSREFAACTAPKA